MTKNGDAEGSAGSGGLEHNEDEPPRVLVTAAADKGAGAAARACDCQRDSSTRLRLSKGQQQQQQAAASKQARMPAEGVGQTGEAWARGRPGWGYRRCITATGGGRRASRTPN